MTDQKKEIITKPVIIIGSGISGLSCAFHLKKLGLSDFTILGSSSLHSATSRSPGYFTGGFWGNFTRLSHAFGLEAAKELWTFGHHAYASIKDYCESTKIECHLGRRLRFILSDEELKESNTAVSQLGSQGFSSRLLGPSSGLTEETLMVQDDGERSGCLSTKQLLKSLEAGCRDHLVQTQVSGIGQNPDQTFDIKTDSQTFYRSDLIVLACHMGAVSLLPELKPILIPVADQCLEVQFSAMTHASAFSEQRGSLISCNHGYDWALNLGNHRFALGGGRHKRKFAGIGDSSPSYHGAIGEQSAALFAKLLGFSKYQLIGNHAAFSEIYPCDELPLIGPLPGNERILIASGFMNQGLSHGFFAGKCLAELLYTGQSSDLPRRLWPERLRSL